MIKVLVIIERCADGTYDVGFYDKRVKFSLRGNGITVTDAIADFYKMNEAMKSHYEELREEFPQVEYDFKYDVASFLNEYTQKFTLLGLGRITGINDRQLSQYASGYKRPTPKTIRKIETSIHNFAAQMANVSFV